MAKSHKLGKKLVMPSLQPLPAVNLEDRFTFTDEGGTPYEVQASVLERIRELGRGAYGVVEEMLHRPSGKIFAVKRVHASVNDESHKRMLVELETCSKSGCCPQMVSFYGAMYREGDVWICMEVMDISLDKFYRECVSINQKIPEPFIARVALAVIGALNYMKTQMNLIHRDVKPSNILLSRQGDVKLCDFGISGHLTDSVAKTVTAGCKPYMPPERIEGESKYSYGVQADVWSLGISLVEIAMGAHPYARWKTPFEQLKQVVEEPPPTIDRSRGYSEIMHDFVSQCLIKNYKERPKYDALMHHPFLVAAKNDNSFDIGKFVSEALDEAKAAKLAKAGEPQEALPQISLAGSDA